MPISPFGVVAWPVPGSTAVRPLHRRPQAYEWLCATTNPGRIVLGGVSSGSLLAALLLSELPKRSLPMPAGVPSLLISPGHHKGEGSGLGGSMPQTQDLLTGLSLLLLLLLLAAQGLSCSAHGWTSPRAEVKRQ